MFIIREISLFFPSAGCYKQEQVWRLSTSSWYRCYFSCKIAISFTNSGYVLRFSRSIGKIKQDRREKLHSFISIIRQPYPLPAEFKNRDMLSFVFQNKLYDIYINEVVCFPQTYAASGYPTGGIFTYRSEHTLSLVPYNPPAKAR